MSERDVVRKDEEQLEHLDKEIAEARQHLREEQHEGERTFIDEEGKDTGQTDDTIAP